MSHSSQSLLLIPCSGGKAGSLLSCKLYPKYVTNFISDDSAKMLLEGRQRAFSRTNTILDERTPPQPALDLYSGNPYKVSGFKECLLRAADSGMHCLIVSGGYGLLRMEEPIHYYQAHMQRTASVWEHVLPKVLLDYIGKNKINRTFVACSTVYSNVLKSGAWASCTETYWYVPRLPPGEGGAMVKIPRLIGEAVVDLVAHRLSPDSRWSGE